MTFWLRLGCSVNLRVLRDSVVNHFSRHTPTYLPQLTRCFLWLTEYGGLGFIPTEVLAYWRIPPLGVDYVKTRAFLRVDSGRALCGHGPDPCSNGYITHLRQGDRRYRSGNSRRHRNGDQ